MQSYEDTEDCLSLDFDQEQEEGQEMHEHFHFTVDGRQSLLRIDKYLSARMFDTSRTRVQAAAQAGYILVNGTPVKSNYLVKPADEISIVMPFEKHEFKLIPQYIPLNIPYEDDALLIVNKPAGLTVHPGHGNYDGTLINALAYHFGMREEVEDADPRMGVLVHRIDKDTSGLLVIAKTEQSQLFLSKQFFDHTITREYYALVWGNIDDDSGTIVGSISRHPSDRLKYTVCKNEEDGKHAVTHYQVLERFGYVTLVKCILETGRTHQIRVHFSHIGHPLFNDKLYGGDRIRNGALYTKFKQFIDNCFEIMPRQALHAKTLGFIHPVTKQEIFFNSELPQEFTLLLEKWRKYSTFNKIPEPESQD